MDRRARAPISRTPRSRQRGLTIIELMIALAIGLLIIAAVSILFASSSRSRQEIESSAEVNENGRYALDVLTRELSQTGFYGSLVTPTAAATAIPSGTMTVANAMCLTGLANLAAWQDSLTYYVLGLASAAGANVDVDPTCIARKAGTDAIFIQRASTCAVGDTDCPAEANADAYLQVSECGSEYSATPIVLAQGGASTFTLQTKTCAGTAAPKRKLVRRIYFISAANALSYQDIPLTGALPDPVVLAENIEQMQIEYAFDTGADGTPDVFAAAPNPPPAPAPNTDWTQVIGARIWLLARSTDPSQNTRNAATFVLGADTTVSVAANAAGNPKRRVYSTYISFVTPKARRES
ncbi:PilW family protein [Variovorax ureilyticus]|uniref:PilW family protein n=1 Tax=Variovorax ureilyticus TaxID=1836198 RepID=A0ABU8V983_9BURK